MILEQYLEDREVWQKNTLETIRKKLVSGNQAVGKLAKEEKLAAIYGFPQIGKTTLILQLLGIDTQFQRKVYNVIRAGVPKGNSSTSTAIIYQKIESEKYGIKYGEGLSNIEFCSEFELQIKIKEIRDKVENNSACEDILHIYIPSKFFSVSVAEEAEISIVDLPGDGSRNVNEKPHVDKIINKYMALSTVNIIACKANEIQSLENLKLPINVEWRNLPHKYIIVLTNSFSLETIRDFFKVKKERRKQCFDDFVKESYKRDIGKILNYHSQIEIFPIDVGSSLETLLSNCKLDEDDQAEVKKVVEATTLEIRKSIQKRRGNGLKSTILDLKAYTSEYAEGQCEKIKNKIIDLKEQKQELENINTSNAKIVEKCNNTIVELQEYCNQYNKLMKYKVFISGQVATEEFMQKCNKYCKRGKVKDPKHDLLSQIREILLSLIRQSFEHYELDCGIINELYETINMEIDLEAAFGEKLHKGRFFSKAIKQEEFIELISDLINNFCEQLKIHILSILQKEIKNAKLYYDVYERYKQWKIQIEGDIFDNNKIISSIDSELKKKEEEIRELNIRRDDDLKLIEGYLCIANQEFDKYKKNLLEQLDSEQYCTHEKILIIIYLGILEKDYRRIVEIGG